jgi:hypothetical protein
VSYFKGAEAVWSLLGKHAIGVQSRNRAKPLSVREGSRLPCGSGYKANKCNLGMGKDQRVLAKRGVKG